MNNSGSIEILSSSSTKLVDLTKLAVKELRQYVGKKPREKKLLQQAKDIDSANQLLISSIPRFHSVCN